MAAHYYYVTPPSDGDYALCGHRFGLKGAKPCGRFSRKCKACKAQLLTVAATLRTAREEMASL